MRVSWAKPGVAPITDIQISLARTPVSKGGWEMESSFLHGKKHRNVKTQILKSSY